jgi:hypothetical protein
MRSLILGAIALVASFATPVLAADCPEDSRQSISGVLRDASGSTPWSADVEQTQPCTVTKMVGASNIPKTCLTEYFGTAVRFRATGTVKAFGTLNVATIQCEVR